jgi:hypothetical protein
MRAHAHTHKHTFTHTCRWTYQPLMAPLPKPIQVVRTHARARANTHTHTHDTNSRTRSRGSSLPLPKPCHRNPEPYKQTAPTHSLTHTNSPKGVRGLCAPLSLFSKQAAPTHEHAKGILWPLRLLRLHRAPPDSQGGRGLARGGERRVRGGIFRGDACDNPYGEGRC